MKISYAQRLEDYHLDLVLGNIRDGFYVDIGGGHPVADNVSFHFYLKGWRGLIFEPQEHLAALYHGVRPRDIILQELVGEIDGEVDFHVVDRLHGFSTTVEQHARNAEQFGAGYSTVRRRVRRLTSALDEHAVKSIDFLKIDVEGAEAAVLAGIDFSKIRPKIICIEAVEPGSMSEAWHAWEPGILAAGYTFAFWDELNRFYVANEHSVLISRFPASMSPWGVVKHFYELGMPDCVHSHPDHALTTRLIRGFLAELPMKSADEIAALLTRSAKGGTLETGKALADLAFGALDAGGKLSAATPEAILGDDRVRAALGRIAAQYDGGMIHDA